MPSSIQSRLILGVIDAKQAEALIFRILRNPAGTVLGELPTTTGSYFRQTLIRIWECQSAYERDWHIFQLRNIFAKPIDSQPTISGPRINKLPEASSLEAALIHLQRIGDYLSRCQNVDCSKPFFIAKKLGQKYCSDACGEPAQQAAKRKWWTRNGKNWRKSKTS